MKGEAAVTIRLAEAAPQMLAHALDLLYAVEHADQALIPDEVRERAEEFREFIERERGRW